MFIDWLFSLFRKPSLTLPLPQVKSIEDIQGVLAQVKYVNTFSDKLINPEVVWAKKTANCVEFASLIRPLLISIGKEPKVVAIKCKNLTDNHVITAFLNPDTFDYFSDANLRHTDFKDLDSLILGIKHSDLVSWKLLT
jgi:hypothetical protein